MSGMALGSDRPGFRPRGRFLALTVEKLLGLCGPQLSYLQSGTVMNNIP